MRPNLKMVLQRVVKSVGVACVLFAAQANAVLIVTLSDDGTGGTLASFEGGGTTTPKAFQQYIDAHEIGDFIAEGGPENTLFSLVDPVGFGVGRSITGIHLDRNPDRFDDIRIQMNAFVDVDYDFSVFGSSVISGLRFADLIAGTFTGSTRPDVAIVGGLTLNVDPPLKVFEPTSLSMLLGGAGLMWLRTRRRKALPEDICY